MKNKNQQSKKSDEDRSHNEEETKIYLTSDSTLQTEEEHKQALKIFSMEKRKDGAERNSAKTGKDFTGPNHGMQGIDKAPGEETSNDQVHFTQDTQKGKKVDADPTENEGKPAEQDL